MKKIILIITVIILIIIGIRLLSNEDDWICQDGQWIKHGNPKSAMPISFCPGSQNIVCDSFNSENCPSQCAVCPPCAACSSISCQTESFCQNIGFDRSWYEAIKKQIYDFNSCISSGNAVMESYPRQCKDASGNLYVENIGNELEKTNLIKINNPRPNQVINSPLTIEGEARGIWFFEASFPVELSDQDGNIIARGVATARSEWMTENFVPFTARFEFSAPTTSQKGILTLKKDNPSGLPEKDDKLIVPVIFAANSTINIKVYFNNNKLDPEISCNKVFSAERRIAKTQLVARAALEELLKGATAAEEKEGYFTNINTGVKIQKLNIINGVAKVDFDKQLEFQVGGSCRVSAIRAQIIETLKQFSTISEVIISVDGRTEDILQP